MSATRATMPHLCDRHKRLSFVTSLLALDRLGVDLHQVSLLAVGTHRNYRGEVVAQSPDPGTPITPDTVVSLEVGFSSAVDTLPCQFFAGLGDAAKSSSGWELRARHFMAPFDATVVRYQALALGERLRFSLGTTDTVRLREFLSLFALDMPRRHADPRQLGLWAALLPSFHNWAGNAEQVGHVLTLLLGRRCSVEENIPVRYDIPSDIQSRLGQKRHRLGRQIVLGDGFIDCDQTYRVHVHGVASDRIRDWMPGGPMHRHLEWLLQTCMPGQLDYRISVHARRGRRKLGDSTEHFRLGYNTYLPRERTYV